MTKLRFISFEGGEGSGKSTQVQLLANRLITHGHHAVKTREPGGAPFAEAIRHALLMPREKPPSNMAQALAFSAARADHLTETIRPALASGAFVICDRFTDSTRVYQCFAGDLSAADLSTLEAMVVAETAPPLTFILDIDPKIGMARATARRQEEMGDRDMNTDMFEARSLAFHETLRQGFLTIARAEPQRCVVLDATRAPAEIADQIWQTVRTRFGI